MVREFLDCRYHRNGVGGESFYAVRFRHTLDAGRPLVAIVEAHYRYEHPEHGWQGTFVIDPEDPTLSWRGDVMYQDLMDAGMWQHIQQQEDIEDMKWRLQAVPHV